MTIDRSQFLPAGIPDGDFPVPLSETCSVPSARMAHLLAGLIGSVESCLEIGTGSGYETCLLAEHCKQVVTLEAHPQPGAAEKLPSNVASIQADGRWFDTGQQFDAVLVTYGTPSIYSIWADQLKEGGRLVAPIILGDSARITVYEKQAGVLVLEDAVAYAPFTEAVAMEQVN